MTFTVRRATLDDVDAMIDLRTAVAREGVWIGAELPLDEAGDRAKFTQTIADMTAGELALMLVAELDGAIVGQLTMHAPIGIAHLGMNIAGDHRGQGLGAAMLADGIEWAREIGAHKVDLECWPWNRAAIALYERFGFVEEGYRRRQYRRKDGSLWDSVVMGLVLDHDAPGHDVRAGEPPRRPHP